MKKLLALFVFILGISGGVSFAQQGDGNADPAKMKERQLKQLKESDLNLTDAQADSVININMELRQQMRGLRELGEDERRTKMKEIDGIRSKRFASALKDETLANKVAAYYQKQRAQRMNGGGNN